MFLQNGHFILKIYVKYRKNGQNRAFGHFAPPLNGVFGGNFTPYSQEGDIRHILGQNVQNFPSFQEEVLKGPKNDHFGPFCA